MKLSQHQEGLNVEIPNRINALDPDYDQKQATRVNKMTSERKMPKLIFKHNKLMDRYSADNKDNGDHYVIVPLSNGTIQTFLNGELVDDRSKSVREAKRNVNEYLEYEQ